MNDLIDEKMAEIAAQILILFAYPLTYDSRNGLPNVEPRLRETLTTYGNTMYERGREDALKEVIHEWNKAEQKLDGTAQGAVNAIEHFRDFITNKLDKTE